MCFSGLQNCENFVRFANGIIRSPFLMLGLWIRATQNSKYVYVKLLKIKVYDFFLKKVIKIIWRIKKYALPLHRQNQKQEIDKVLKKVVDLKKRIFGEMAEWSNAAVLKTVVLLQVPGVRIPLSPLDSGHSAVRLAYLLWEQRVAGSNPAAPTWLIILFCLCSSR